MLRQLLRLTVLWSSFIFLINAQVINPASTSSTLTQTSLQTSSSSTSSLTTSVSSASTSASLTSTSSTPTTTTPTKTATTPATTLLQGPVGQPASTTAVPGGPTPYIYTTVVNGVTEVVSDIFTPTSPSTVSVTPTVVGTILDFSSWLAIYSPTHTSSSASARCSSPPIAFSLILMILLGILGGGGMVFV